MAEYKLRPADSLREVELVKSMGVEFCFGVTVGRDVAIEALERDFAAIFLAVGLAAPEPLGLSGGNLEGVVDALRFIADYKTAQTIPVGRRVAVIGGGNTAIDAANAAKRLGAEEVSLIYRRSEREMPAFRFEYENSKLEGVRFLFQSQPVAIHPDASDPRRVSAIECVRIELGAPDASGRRRPTLVAGSNFLLPCDMVIPATGQSRFLDFLSRFRGVELREGNVVTDPETGRTSNPRYFAGGDCVNGGREVVDAVAEASARELLSRVGSRRSMADLTTDFAGGIRCPNPFWLASGPPTNCGDQVMRAFDAGWGGAVWKTLGEPIVNVSSRYSSVDWNGQRMMGLNNIELITDRPLDVNLREIAEVKKRYPKHAVIASLMVESKREAWHDIVKRSRGRRRRRPGAELRLPARHERARHGQRGRPGSRIHRA